MRSSRGMGAISKAKQPCGCGVMDDDVDGYAKGGKVGMKKDPKARRDYIASGRAERKLKKNRIGEPTYHDLFKQPRRKPKRKPSYK